MIKFVLCDDSQNILDKLSIMLNDIFKEEKFDAIVEYHHLCLNI